MLLPLLLPHPTHLLPGCRLIQVEHVEENGKPCLYLVRLCVLIEG